MNKFLVCLVLGLIAFGAVESSVLKVRISHVTSDIAQSTGHASTSTSKPLRVYKGTTTKLTFYGNGATSTNDGLFDGDKAMWVSGATDCQTVATAPGPATVTNRVASFTFTTAGTYQLCYMHRHGGVDRPWQYYGTTQTLSVVEVTGVSDLDFWDAQSLELTITCTGCLDNDWIAYAGNNAACSTLGAGTTAGDSLQKLASGKVTLKSADAAQSNKICFRFADVTSTTSNPWQDTGKTLTSTAISTDNALWFLFPTRIESAGNSKNIKTGIKVRVGGPRLKTNDVFSIYDAAKACTDAARTDKTLTVDASTTMNGKPTATHTFAANVEASATATGDTATSVLGVCYHGVGQAKAQKMKLQNHGILATGDNAQAVRLVSTTNCGKGIDKTNGNLDYVINLELSGTAAKTIKSGTAVKYFVSGCTNTGDVFKGCKTDCSDNNCNGAARFTAAALADGTFPEVTFTVPTNSDVDVLCKNGDVTNKRAALAGLTAVTATYKFPKAGMINVDVPSKVTVTNAINNGQVAFSSNSGSDYTTCHYDIMPQSGITSSTTTPFNSLVNGAKSVLTMDGNGGLDSNNQKIHALTTAPAGDYKICYRLAADAAWQMDSAKFKLGKKFTIFPQNFPHASADAGKSGKFAFQGFNTGDKIQFIKDGQTCKTGTQANADLLTTITALATEFTRTNSENFLNDASGATLAACVSFAADAVNVQTYPKALWSVMGTTVTATAPGDANTEITISPTVFYKGQTYNVEITGAKSVIQPDDKVIMLKDGGTTAPNNADKCTSGAMGSALTVDFNKFTDVAKANFTFTPDTATDSTYGLCIEHKAQSVTAQHKAAVRVVEADSIDEMGKYGTAGKVYLYQGTAVTGKFKFNHGAAADEITFVTGTTACSTRTNGVAIGNPAAGNQPKVHSVANFATGLANAFSSNAGGEFSMCVQAGGSGTFYDSGKKLWVLQVTGRYPTTVIAKVATDIYFNGAGFQTGDQFYFTTAANCDTIPTAASATTTAVSTITVANSRMKGSVDAQATAGGDWNLCIRSKAIADTTASNTANVYEYLNGMKLTVKFDATDSTKNGVVPKLTEADSNIVYARAGNATTFAFGSTPADGTIKAGHLVRQTANDVACTASSSNPTAAADTTDAAVVKTDAEAWNAAKVVLTNKNANAKPYNLCYKFQTGVFYAMSQTLQVSEVTGFAPNFKVVTGKEATKKFTLTGLGFTDKDAVCIASPGSACPTTCNTYGLTVTDTATTKTATIDIPNTAFTVGGDWTVCYKAGGKTTSGPSTPYELTQKITAITFTTYPTSVLKTGGTGDAKRAVSLCNGKGTHANDLLYFVADSATSCSATTGEKANLTYAFDTAQTNQICFKSGLDTGNAFTLVDVAATKVTTVDTRSIGATPNRVASGVPTTLTFTGTVQSGDEVIVVKNGADCTAATTPTALTGGSGTIALANCAATMSVTLARGAATTDKMPVCVKLAKGETVTAPATGWKPLDVNTKTIEIAHVASMTPTTLLHDVPDKITFSGDYITTDDFASYVASWYTDCTKAWMYEQAVATNTAYFQLPRGDYHLCYFHKGVNTGYKYHSNHMLQVRQLTKITPAFASTALATDFELTAGMGSSMPVAGDRVQFTTGACDGAKDVYNVTVASGKYWAKAVKLSAAGSYKVCYDAVNSASYNAPTGSQFAANAILAGVTVTAYDKPTLGAFSPTSVVVGSKNTMMFWGGYLAKDHVWFGNDTCTNTTMDTTKNADVHPVTESSSATRYMTELKDYMNAKTGAYTPCYKYSLTTPTAPATQTENPLKFATKLEVVSVDKITPTGVLPTAKTAGTNDLATITFTGYFGSTTAAKDNWAVWISTAGWSKGDCAKKAPTAMDKQFITLTSTTAGTASFNFTDNKGEYALCVKFSGHMEWTEYATPNFIFSSRAIELFAPAAVTPSESTIDFKGFGIRNYDRVTFIFANVTTGVDAACDASDKIAAMSSNVTTDPLKPGLGQAKVTLAGVRNMVTEYRLCYKFVGTSAWYHDQITTVMKVEDAKLNKLTLAKAQVAGNLTALNNVLVPISFAVEATGISSGDRVRFIMGNSTSTDAMCDPATNKQGTRAVAPTRANFAWSATFPPQSFSATGGYYIACYKFASASWKVYTSIALGVQATKVIRGSFPRRGITFNTDVNIGFFGLGMSTSDAAEFVEGTTCNAAGTANKKTVTKQTVLGQEVFAITYKFAKDKTAYNLCYQFNGGSFTLQPAATALTGSCNATTQCATATPYFCPETCSCSATRCAAQPRDRCLANFGAGLVFCPPSGACVSTPAECPHIGTCGGSTPARCALGGCAESLKKCAPIERCDPATHIRCGDGSCGLIADPNVCLDADGKALTRACPNGATVCPSGACPDANGGCQPFSGCPYNAPFRCSDCRCHATVADCDAAALKNSTGYICTLEGTTANDRLGCKCLKTRSIPEGALTLGKGTIRRFIVRASAQQVVTIADDQNLDTLKVTLPAGAFAGDTCVLQYGPVAGSLIDGLETSTSNVVSAGIDLAVVDANGATCQVVSGQTVTAQFLATTVPASTDASKLTCNTMTLSTATVAYKYTAPSTYECQFATEVAPVCLLDGQAAAPTPTPSGSPTPAGPTPNGTNPTPTNGTTPTPGTGGGVSSASTVSMSLFVSAVVALATVFLF